MRSQPTEIVHLDERVLVVDKPAGWLVIPGRSPQDPRPVLKLHLESEHGRLWTVHRLDEPVSGLLVFARDAATHRELNRLFETRAVTKTYEALTAGRREPGELLWDAPLRRGKKRSYVAHHGKPARTRARCLGGTPAGLRWELHPETGRTHQLRVHCAHAGFPIHGDALYGSEIVREDGIALRAVRLAIPGFGDFGVRG